MSEPIVEVLASKEVVAGIATFVVAFLTLLVAFIRWGVAWVNRKVVSIQTQMADISESASKAETEARGAREGVTNSHGTHLRDDLDEVRAGMKTLVRKVNEIDRARMEEARSRERRDQRAEDQIDGLRLDVRALTASAEKTHERLETRLECLESSRKH